MSAPLQKLRTDGAKIPWKPMVSKMSVGLSVRVWWWVDQCSGAAGVPWAADDSTNWQNQLTERAVCWAGRATVGWSHARLCPGTEHRVRHVLFFFVGSEDWPFNLRTRTNHRRYTLYKQTNIRRWKKSSVCFWRREGFGLVHVRSCLCSDMAVIFFTPAPLLFCCVFLKNRFYSVSKSVFLTDIFFFVPIEIWTKNVGFMWRV